MRTAEKAGRIFFTLIGILGVMLLLLPQIGISVDSIMSGSMEPVLRTGGIVFTDTKERRPEIGDIVTYQVGETRVTHRVIRKEHKGYVTKGDANNREDPTVVTADQIIGKVIFSLPCLGYAAVFGSATNTVIAPILIGLEVFGSQNAIPLVVDCLLAYMVNGNHSIYGAQVKARCSFEEK